jgi:hypothetical protein
MRTTIEELIFIGLTLLLIWLVLRWVVKVTITTGKTLLTIGAILLLLQFGFGIGPRAILYRFWELWQRAWSPPAS